MDSGLENKILFSKIKVDFNREVYSVLYRILESYKSMGNENEYYREPLGNLMVHNLGGSVWNDGFKLQATELVDEKLDEIEEMLDSSDN